MPDKTTIRAMVLVELLLKENDSNLETEGIASLEVYRIFKDHFKLSDTIFYHIQKILRAYGVIKTGYTEISLIKPKYILFCKQHPIAHKIALKEIGEK